MKGSNHYFFFINEAKQKWIYTTCRPWIATGAGDQVAKTYTSDSGGKTTNKTPRSESTNVAQVTHVNALEVNGHPDSCWYFAGA